MILPFIMKVDIQPVGLYTIQFGLYCISDLGDIGNVCTYLIFLRQFPLCFLNKFNLLNHFILIFMFYVLCYCLLKAGKVGNSGCLPTQPDLDNYLVHIITNYLIETFINMGYILSQTSQMSKFQNFSKILICKTCQMGYMGQTDRNTPTVFSNTLFLIRLLLKIAFIIL